MPVIMAARPMLSAEMIVSRPASGRAPLRARATGDGQGLGEEVLERLRRAEEEAATLRKELAALEQEKTDRLAAQEPERPARRIDSGDLKRETLFSGDAGDSSNWLTERVIGTGPAETGAELTEEERATVGRRLAVGVVLGAAALAFGLTPTEELNLSRPQKPLFFYLVPLVRVRDLLTELEEPVQEARFDEVRAGLSSILGAPNNARENMVNAKLLLPDRAKRDRVRCRLCAATLCAAIANGHRCHSGSVTTGCLASLSAVRRNHRQLHRVRQVGRREPVL